MTEPKTLGGEVLVQSNLSGPLAEAVDIYHKVSIGETLTLDHFNKLLQVVVDNAFPDNYRVRMTTCVIENACKFPDSMGDTIQTLLTMICNATKNVQETAVRSIPWLCRTSPQETQFRVVCELSDVLLQLCMTTTGSLQVTATKALEELLVLESKAVVSKLFIWIGDQRSDEVDTEICKQEKEFATKKLKEILASKQDCLGVEVIQGLQEILIAQLRKCSTLVDVRSVFMIFRSMKGFDERNCAQIISIFLTECFQEKESVEFVGSCTPFQIIVTLISCAPLAARRIDEQLASQLTLKICTLPMYKSEIELWQCAATLSAIISESTVAQLFPSLVHTMIEYLTQKEIDSINFSMLEAFLAIFTASVQRVPTLMLKLIEEKGNPETDGYTFFQKLNEFKVYLTQHIQPEMIFAAKKKLIELTASEGSSMHIDRAISEIPTCIPSLHSYLTSYTLQAPRIPNPMPSFSWESPYQPKEINGAPPSKKQK